MLKILKHLLKTKANPFDKGVTTSFALVPIYHCKSVLRRFKKIKDLLYLEEKLSQKRFSFH